MCTLQYHWKHSLLPFKHLPFPISKNLLFFQQFSPRWHLKCGIPQHNFQTKLEFRNLHILKTLLQEWRLPFFHSTSYHIDHRADKSKQKESPCFRPLPYQGFGLGWKWKGNCCGFGLGWSGKSKRGKGLPSPYVVLISRQPVWLSIWFAWRKWQVERFFLQAHRERERPHSPWQLHINWDLAL